MMKARKNKRKKVLKTESKKKKKKETKERKSSKKITRQKKKKKYVFHLCLLFIYLFIFLRRIKFPELFVFLKIAFKRKKEKKNH